MAVVDVLVSVWKEWGIQVLVLLSFALQVTLLIIAEVRRRKDSGAVRAVVWSAYLLADSTAIYALGHMSVATRSPENQLMAFWAPFLLLHLGGQDNITAYAIEDNRLWLRHLQALGVQIAAAAYVLYESSIVGSRTLLWRAAILMFVVGVLKYGERVWALKGASGSNESITKNYKDTISGFISAVPHETLPKERQDTEDLVVRAHLVLNITKEFLERPIGEGRQVMYTGVGGEAQGNLFTLVEMQLSLMHDLLYSKAEVMHTWYGLCLRTITSASTAAAFVMFYRWGQSGHGHGYRRADVAVTYALLVGAIVLETASLLRAIFSSWALVDTKLLRLVVSPVRRLVLPERRRWWSDSMGQHNLFELLDRRKTSRSSRIARWARVEDWWNTMVHSRRIPVPPKIKQLLVELLFKVPEQAWEEKKKTTYTAMGSVRSDMEFGDSILVWHIATDMYLRWYRDQQKQTKDQSKDEEQPADKPEDREKAKKQQELVEAIEVLSNYMVFLLVARPYMLPGSSSRDEYVGLCFDLGMISAIPTDDLVRSLQGFGSKLNDGITHGDIHDKLGLAGNNEQLRVGSQLGAKLIDAEGSINLHKKRRRQGIMNLHADGWGISATDSLDRKVDDFGLIAADRLEMIASAWVWMLFDAGSRCGAYPHTKQLSNGGELLTVAALLKAHVKANTDWENTRKKEASGSSGGTSTADVSWTELPGFV